MSGAGAVCTVDGARDGSLYSEHPDLAMCMERVFFLQVGSQHARQYAISIVVEHHVNVFLQVYCSASDTRIRLDIQLVLR